MFRVSGVRLASGAHFTSSVVVNCAGAWAAEVAGTAGVRIPVIPVKRQIFALDTKVKPEGPLTLTIFPSGPYFRAETGNLILLGKFMEDDPVGQVCLHSSDFTPLGVEIPILASLR
jgi:FAD-dependent oxidoreductase domain-containing protein 1